MNLTSSFTMEGQIVLHDNIGYTIPHGQLRLQLVIGELLESIVRDSLLTHFNTHDLLSNNQHGFIPGRSCVTQLSSVLDDWTRAMTEGYNTDVVVPHKRLIHKLRAYGIGGKLLEWLQSFLSDREQSVVINSVFSSWRPVTSGVPQGSVLGPLLFAIYVNDLPSIVSSLFMFADDLKLYRSITQPLDTTLLQHDVNTLFHWAQTWLLNLSIPKCYVMSVGNTNPNYILDNVPLAASTCVRDLGMWIDDKLKFHEHTSVTIAKANRILALMKRSFNINMNIFLRLYTTLVRPILEYANIAWGPTFITDQKSLEKVQRRATKMLPELYNLTYAERLHLLKLPSLYYRRRRGDMIFVYQLIHNFFNIDTSAFFIPATVTTTRGHNYKLFKSHTCCLARTNFFSNRVIEDWNHLPNDVVNAETLNTFKSLLDNYWTGQFYLFL